MLSSVFEVWIGECGIIATLEVPWSGQIRDGFPGFEDEGHLDVFRAGRALKTWPIFSATRRRLFGSITRSGGLPEPYRRSGVAGAFGRNWTATETAKRVQLPRRFGHILGADENRDRILLILKLDIWCREGGANPHEVALGGF